MAFDTKLPTRVKQEAPGGIAASNPGNPSGITGPGAPMTAADWAALNAADLAGGGPYLSALAGQQTTPPVGQSQSQLDATAIINQELASWGFGQDAEVWAQTMIQSNDSIDQVLWSLRQQPFYKTSIFGQVADARSKAGLPAMTEAQILSYQDYATGVAQQAGLPPGFINTPELVTLMGNDVSTTELDARITQGYTAFLKSDPATQAEFQQYAGLGVGPGAAAAYFLDPKRALPLIQQQFAAAQMGGAAINTGYGTITQQQAQLMAQLGTTQTQAETGFTDLAKKAQLMNALPGIDEQNITEAQQLGAEFQGNAQDQQLISQRTSQREAVFEGNYHFAETQNRGITGLGSVQRNG